MTQPVEEARNCLVGLLRRDIPRIVGELDEEPVKLGTTRRRKAALGDEFFSAGL